MKKYPFWVLKTDALRLLKGKWNPLVLALFVPFLVYVVYAVRFTQMLEQATSTVQIERYLQYQNITAIVFSLLLEILWVGMFRNLNPKQEKANFFSIYWEGLKSSIQMLPALCLQYVLPMAFTWLLTSDYVVKFYDYLMFSLMDFTVYSIIIEVLLLLVTVLSVYLTFSLLMASCVVAHHPEYNGFRVVKESFYCARGNRMYLFWLSFSFMGWFFLGSLAFTIGVLWAGVYLKATHFAYYRRLEFDQESELIVTVA